MVREESGGQYENGSSRLRNKDRSGGVQTADRNAMIVPTMSPAEVVAEAIKDLPALWNKMKEPVARLQRRAKVDPRIRGKEQLIPYRSHAGNNWFVVMRATKKVISLIPFVYYYGTDGKLRAARICSPGISLHLSAHVLDQYFARFNKTQGMLERFKEFVVENMDLGIESAEGVNEIRVGVRHGYIIGRWEVQDRVIQLTTFVDHGKLFAEQLEQMDRLDEQRYESARPGRRATPGYAHPWAKGQGPFSRPGR